MTDRIAAARSAVMGVKGWEAGRGHFNVVVARDIARAVVAALDALPTDAAKIEDWRGRLATQCGETLAARYQRDRLREQLEECRLVLNTIARTSRDEDARWAADDVLDRIK